MIQFSSEDEQLLKQKGITQEKVNQQIATFKEGIPFVNLKNAAVIDNGILKFSEEEQQQLVNHFEAKRNSLSLLKFVPASGAASRMFKAMFNFLSTFDFQNESLHAYLEHSADKVVKAFFADIENLPFYDIIKSRITGKTTNADEEAYLFVKEMLTEEGLNYGFYPKGLLPFHKYENATVTPFEEHLKEAVLYASTDGKANVHFTISEQHNEMFQEEYNLVNSKIAATTKTQFNVTYSNQKPSTDTIAVTLSNEPFRNNDGSILFRPGGHGALIENLNDQDADIIFIKNIDNVVVDRNLEAVSNSKKMLAGILLKTQERAFTYAAQLDNGEVTTSDQIQEIKTFLEQDLNVRFSNSFGALSTEEQKELLKAKLNRPIRICGMVKNEGEPGGGPFWITDQQGKVSLQIIESAQIDKDNSQQVSILKESTHFNPVDLVCAVRNYKGEKYDLLKYVDTKQGFITGKTKEGKELKALELPGLWNGAMAFWNTIFIEVPLVTFNPVKTTVDLLKITHQA